MEILYRRAVPGDYDAILTLQSSNYIGNLPEDHRKQGFLSAEFTAGQVAAIAEELGTTVAVVGHRVVGFLSALRREFNTGSPVIAKMLDSYDLVKFEGKLLGSYSSYIYGPVCVDRDYRGKGLLRGLYEAQKKDLAGQFDVGVAFVSRDNPHSLRAHAAGLDMTEVGDFEVRGKTYVILAFRIPSKAGS
jgi:predicted GNAT superfamily acetyltransferase